MCMQKMNEKLREKWKCKESKQDIHLSLKYIIIKVQPNVIFLHQKIGTNEKRTILNKYMCSLCITKVTPVLTNILVKETANNVIKLFDKVGYKAKSLN